MSNTKSEPTIIARVAAVPLVDAVVSYTSSIADRAKSLNVYVREGADFIEFTLKMGVECIYLYLEDSLFMDYLRNADSYLLDTFNSLVKRYPLIDALPMEIVDAAQLQYIHASESVLTQYKKTRNGVEGRFNEHINTIAEQYNGRGAPMVADIKERIKVARTDIQEQAAPIKERAEPIIADLQDAAPVAASFKDQSNPILEGNHKKSESFSQ
ncbi:hypothetical protein SARC_10022 [Sphaeroforma arctica JP610]|uniref:Uncharacterized protein n=1 Tax=Sphaeroforma arctica JP610 TaxID=667725 RepID=A0A0L0FL81_9EUKA|nr:hypothetical protein SARC_10022 [Sphaeroforma arctica JP610]KNC77520.1 hypothetical protein SARC_10022 [Sphaeroforma arctica JP610]|eukprot:XP_014151422.1 hypothetical protein SARC_10022 [Sphaeroforma arctica JP610]